MPDNAPGLTLRVRLTPRGGADRIMGWVDEPEGKRHLAVRVAAPPVDGLANAALIKTLAKALGVPRRAVSITAGARARIKTVSVDGTAEDLAHKLAVSLR